MVRGVANILCVSNFGNWFVFFPFVVGGRGFRLGDLLKII